MRRECLLNALQELPDEEVPLLAADLFEPPGAEDEPEQAPPVEDDGLSFSDAWSMTSPSLTSTIPRVHIPCVPANKLRLALLQPKKGITKQKFSKPRHIETLAREAGAGLFVCVDGMMKSTAPVAGCTCNGCERCFHQNVLEIHGSKTWKVEHFDACSTSTRATFVQNVLLPASNPEQGPSSGGERRAIEKIAEDTQVPLAIWFDGIFRATPVSDREDNCHCGGCEYCLHKSIIRLRQVMFGTN